MLLFFCFFFPPDKPKFTSVPDSSKPTAELLDGDIGPPRGNQGNVWELFFL